ncbi:hypothetical protein D0962_37495 [Leptolyngbyaceae cyanobacterium CCMR0082]|uniref:Uncharacterized protein n=1 Tax=Adonisia turfae CCMR0082 TaxID=2304604 RepID=A0A6M0SIF1_9CYAN|nr:hypothetical protein [Adonisia turfae]NEZ68358.1 hypothetical protein [Adonisia turfae CCMR0082]
MAKRLQVPFLGEYYNDLLVIEAWLKDRSTPAEAQSLLRSALIEREATRSEIIERLARKRGISADVLTADILAGTAEHLTSEEYATLRDQQEQQADDE